MATSRLTLAGVCSAALLLAGCANDSVSPLSAALGAADEQDTQQTFVDLHELYPDHDAFIIVCGEDFRPMALKHANLPADAVRELKDTENALVAYSSNSDAEPTADIVAKTDIELCDGINSTAIQLSQTLQGFSAVSLKGTERGPRWRRDGTEPALF